MYDVSHSIQGALRDRPAERRGADSGRGRNRRRIATFASLALLAWSIVELVSLGLRHTVGSELYGVLVAALAVAGGVINLVLLASSRKGAWAVAGSLVLWTVVALGGLAGVVAHVVGPVPGHGPIDPRPRPIAAPLVFTAMGAIGGLTVVLGYRAGTIRLRIPGEEQ